jgi:Emfourin
MMRIQFERTGGFTGMRLALDLTESDLPADEWQTLQAALQQAEFFQLPRKVAGGGQPDRFTYQITVETATNSHTVELGDGEIPDNVQPLIQQLNLLARTHR